MKALSIHQPWAGLIAAGEKTIETRTRPTRYRGDLLICASKRGWRKDDSPHGVAVCIVRLDDCRPMTTADETAACGRVYPRAWSWVLTDLRVVPPVPVRGRQSFFNVDWDECLRTFSESPAAPPESGTQPRLFP